LVFLRSFGAFFEAVGAEAFLDLLIECLGFGGLDALGFAFGFGEVWWPGSVAEAFGFVAGGECGSWSSEPAEASMASCGLPRVAKRWGMVRTVKSAGLASGTSCQLRGAETRASGSGRTE
jgi:hypothetical protein